jgi:hypothetical protein
LTGSRPPWEGAPDGPDINKKGFFMHVAPRRAVPAALLLAVMAVLAVAAPSSAKLPDKKTIKGTVVFQHKQHPDPALPGNCSAVVFVQWVNQRAYVGTSVDFVIAGRPDSKAATPPKYDDTYTLMATYTTGPGTHWVNIGYSYQNAFEPSDCSDADAKHRQIFGQTATVTLEITDKCGAARDAYEAAKLAVTKATKRLKGTTGKTRTARLKALANAKSRRAKAKTRFSRNC